MNALITGGSSGIGLELAKQFAEHGVNVILVAHDQKTLDEATSLLTNQYKIKAKNLAIDLSKPSAAQKVHSHVTSLGWNIDYLVNNAGFGNFGAFLETDWKREEAMIAVNITTLTNLTKLFLPAMAKNKHGKILNLASTAAFEPGPFMAVYYATKTYVLSFSQAINSELRGTGVTVTALCPGPTQTNFAAAAHATENHLFTGTLPTAKAVARYGYKAMMQGKSVAIHGFANKTLIFFTRFLPRDLLTAASRKISNG